MCPAGATPFARLAPVLVAKVPIWQLPGPLNVEKAIVRPVLRAANAAVFLGESLYCFQTRQLASTGASAQAIQEKLGKSLEHAGALADTCGS